MSRAEHLIDNLLEARAFRQRPPGGPVGGAPGVEKGKELSGAEVAGLQSGQPVLVKGKRAVILSITKMRNNIEVVYVPGVRSTGRERYLDVDLRSTVTPIQYYTRTQDFGNIPYAGESLTPGMINAWNKQHGKLVCPSCNFVLPKYVGRYPETCGNCGEMFPKGSVI